MTGLSTGAAACKDRRDSPLWRGHSPVIRSNSLKGHADSMTPFAIAGVQMHVTTQSNIDAMQHRLDLLMHLYPWVQMVVFSELACYGPLLQHAQPLPGAAEEALQEMA